MRERLYLVGCPTTPVGWTGFGLAMLFGAAGSYLYGGPLLLTLVLLSWPLTVATAYWPAQHRLVCYLATWVLLWRIQAPALGWYLVVPVAALTAGALVWMQEERRIETGPVG